LLLSYGYPTSLAVLKPFSVQSGFRIAIQYLFRNGTEESNLSFPTIFFKVFIYVISSSCFVSKVPTHVSAEFVRICLINDF
jgi:hypothetical protein